MNDELQAAWDAAFATPGTPIDIGRAVVCDSCNEDYTNSPASGGFVFGSYAICPTCAPRWLKNIQEEAEEYAIRARCAEGQSFGDFVRAYRGDNNSITITFPDEEAE